MNRLARPDFVIPPTSTNSTASCICADNILCVIVRRMAYLGRHSVGGQNSVREKRVHMTTPKGAACFSASVPRREGLKVQ